MANKLTFEAKIDGIERVIEHLTKAESRLESLGSAGSKAFEAQTTKLKEFQKTIEDISKSNTGMGDLLKNFSKLSETSQLHIKSISDDILKNMRSAGQKAVEELAIVERKLSTIERQRQVVESRGYAPDEKRRVLQRLDEREFEAKTQKAGFEATISETSKLHEATKKSHAKVIDPTTIQAMQAWGKSPYEGLGAGVYQDITGMPLTKMGAIGMAAKGVAGVVGGVIGAAQTYDMYRDSVRYDTYQREQNAFVAKRNYETYAAQKAMQGDFTQSFVKMGGFGEQGMLMSDPNFEADVNLKTTMQSRWARALAGAATGFGAGALIGGGVLSVPTALLGAVGGGIYGALSAPNKDREQIKAEMLQDAASRDDKRYGPLLEKAGQTVLAMSQSLEKTERMFGFGATKDTYSSLSSRGVTLSEMQPIADEFAKYGLMAPKESTAIYKAKRVGASESYIKQYIRESASRRQRELYYSAEAARQATPKDIDDEIQRQWDEDQAKQGAIRSSAVPAWEMQSRRDAARKAIGARQITPDRFIGDINRLANIAGMNTAGSVEAFGMITDYGGKAAQNWLQGAGVTGAMATASVAAMAAGPGGDATSVERTTSAINMANRMSDLGKGNSMASMLQIGALSKLGITNPMTQDLWIKKDLNNSATLRQLAIFLFNRDPDTYKNLRQAEKAVKDAFSGIGGAIEGIGNMLMSKEDQMAWKNTTGENALGSAYAGSPNRLGVKEAYDLSTTGMDAFDAAKDTGTAGDRISQATQFEKQAENQARNNAVLTQQIDEVAKKLGMDLQTAITTATVKGLEQMAKSFKDTVGQIDKDKATQQEIIEGRKRDQEALSRAGRFGKVGVN